MFNISEYGILLPHGVGKIIFIDIKRIKKKNYKRIIFTVTVSLWRKFNEFYGLKQIFWKILTKHIHTRIHITKNEFTGKNEKCNVGAHFVLAYGRVEERVPFSSFRYLVKKHQTTWNMYDQWIHTACP